VFGNPSHAQEAQAKAEGDYMKSLPAVTPREEYDRTHKQNADSPLALGGVMQDWHKYSYPGEDVSQAQRQTSMTNAAAQGQAMREKVGPYSDYLMDLMAARGGQSTSLGPRTLADLKAMGKLTGKTSPGVDFFKKTKAKDFAGVMDELRKANPPKTPVVQNQMEVAKKGANARTPVKLSGDNI